MMPDKITQSMLGFFRRKRNLLAHIERRGLMVNAEGE
jgi:hypothetical protein